MVDGHAMSWQRLCQLRRKQLEAQKAAQPTQPASFELKEDLRAADEQTIAGRHRQRLYSRAPTWRCLAACGDVSVAALIQHFRLSEKAGLAH
jgi:anti-sigma-K factor RskA